MKTKEEIFKEYQEYYRWSISDVLMKFHFLWFSSMMIGVPALLVVALLLENTPLSFFEVFLKIFDSMGENIIATWWIFLVIINPFAWSIAEDSLLRKFLRKNPDYEKIVTANEISQHNFNAIFRKN
ncbi:MAG: hypothetical protein WC678_01760 [Parcubacteria group bacterium]|jgi:hypothetical protein